MHISKKTNWPCFHSYSPTGGNGTMLNVDFGSSFKITCLDIDLHNLNKYLSSNETPLGKWKMQ